MVRVTGIDSILAPLIRPELRPHRGRQIMGKSLPLTVEKLEDRSVPAVFGTPWSDSSHITLSFAPDGTLISNAPSNLTSFLGENNAAGRDEILRAYQNWVASANINIGLVADSGDAFDAPGEVQGDSRFGDIRIGARAWASDVLALTTPFNYFNPGSGNVAINSGVSYSVAGSSGTYDLFTVIMQESGHSLGLGNSTNTNSVMYEWYQGKRTG